jgi:hypothetical protein
MSAARPHFFFRYSSRRPKVKRRVRAQKWSPGRAQAGEVVLRKKGKEKKGSIKMGHCNCKDEDLGPRTCTAGS